MGRNEHQLTSSAVVLADLTGGSVDRIAGLRICSLLEVNVLDNELAKV